MSKKVRFNYLLQQNVLDILLYQQTAESCLLAHAPLSKLTRPDVSEIQALLGFSELVRFKVHSTHFGDEILGFIIRRAFLPSYVNFNDQ